MILAPAMMYSAKSSARPEAPPYETTPLFNCSPPRPRPKRHRASTAQFLLTLLTNASCSNVIGGQVVMGILPGRTVQVFRGMKKKHRHESRNHIHRWHHPRHLHCADHSPSIAISAVDSALSVLPVPSHIFVEVTDSYEISGRNVG
jgi:hypothetical protein